MTATTITNARVLKIAVPIVISNATVPLLGAVDTGVVGQIEAAAPIAAVGVGSVILGALYWVFGFLRMGTTGLAAQALGQNDRAEVAALLTRALMIGFAGGLAIILGQNALFTFALGYSDASAEVEEMAGAYMGIRVWSAPAMIALYGILGWLIAAERTGAVLAIQVVMNLTNILLDLVFVLGFGWGVEGVALATFLAEWSGLALGLWLCRDTFRQTLWRNWARVLDRTRLIRMAKVNSDILIRSLALQSMMVSFVFLATDLGDITVAANQVLLQFLLIVAYALDGFAFAAEALVGQAMGARAVAPLRRAAALSTLWGLVLCALLSVVFWAFGPTIIDLMTVAPDVRAAARDYLPWLILAPILGLWCFMLDGIFIGATRTTDMRNMMLLSAAIYFVAAFALMPSLANHGLWAALMISYIARAVTLAARYPALERSATA